MDIVKSIYRCTKCKRSMVASHGRYVPVAAACILTEGCKGFMCRRFNEDISNLPVDYDLVRENGRNRFIPRAKGI